MDAAGEFVLRAVGRLLFDGFFYLTARVVLPWLTFGRWCVKSLTDRRNVGWFDKKRQPDGTMLVGYDLAIVLGMVIWVLIGLLLVALYFLVR